MTLLSTPPAPSILETTGRRAALRRLAPVLGLGGTILALLGSWIPSLWGDEAASVMSAERPLPSLLSMLTRVDAVHGTYYLGLHFWIDAFGASPFSVRLPPAIAVGFVIAGVVAVVGELGSQRLALIAGIVCCVVPRVTYMGEETRAYAFSAAFATWATYVLVRLLRDRSESRRWWLLYGALMAVGVYSFLYVGLFVLVHGLIIATSRPTRRLVGRWALSSGLVVVAAVPLVVFAYLEKAQIAFLGTQDNVTFSALTKGLWFSTWGVAVVAWTLIVVAVAAYVLRVRRRSQPSEAVRRRAPGPSLTVVAGFWLVVPTLVLVLAWTVKPAFTTRYASFSAPAAAILVAVGIEVLARGGWLRMLGLTLVVAAVAAPVYLSQRTPYAKNGSDWAEISTVVGSHAQAGDGIVFDDGTRPSRRPRLALHTYPAGFTGLNDVTLKTPFTRSDTWYDRTYTVAQAEALGRFRGVPRVWVVEYTGYGFDDYGIADLEASGYAVQATYATHNSRIIEMVHGR